MIPEKKKKIKQIKKKVSSILFAVAVLALVIFLVSTNWKINKRRNDLIEKADLLRNQVLELEQKNRELKQKEAEAGSLDHLEEAAREQLDLKKPGEEVVVIQKEEEQQTVVEEEKSWWEKFKGIWTRD
jgi:cell division protein FtsL